MKRIRNLAILSAMVALSGTTAYADAMDDDFPVKVPREYSRTQPSRHRTAYRNDDGFGDTTFEKLRTKERERAKSRKQARQDKLGELDA